MKPVEEPDTLYSFQVTQSLGVFGKDFDYALVPLAVDRLDRCPFDVFEIGSNDPDH
jgi:hypothetical protein